MDSSAQVALVFGREESGLSAQELQACTHLCSIPAGSMQPSLNLSHAVAVALAQLFDHASSPLEHERSALPEARAPSLKGACLPQYIDAA